MVNLRTKSGKNNCYYNISGKCTSSKITRGLAGESGRYWDSEQNCTFTQDGAQSLCSEYFFENIYKETENYITTFKWDKTWEDGKDHSKEVGLEQYFLRMCANCGKRRGLHIDNKISYVFERSLLEKYAICP